MQKSQANFSTIPFQGLLIILATWTFSLTVRFLVKPGMMQVCLALLFCLMGLRLLKLTNLQSFSAVFDLFAKPKSKRGFFICISYVALTLLSFFIMGHGSEWSYRFEQAQFQSWYYGIVVPLYEEFFFRGAVLAFLLYCFQKLKSSHHWAIYIGALIFWIFHAPSNPIEWINALSAGQIPMHPGSFLLGLICGYVAYWDKSLWFAVAIHGLANVAGPFWSSVIPHSDIFGIFYG